MWMLQENNVHHTSKIYIEVSQAQIAIIAQTLKQIIYINYLKEAKPVISHSKNNDNGNKVHCLLLALLVSRYGCPCACVV